MKIAIHQPDYIPWLGYFYKMYLSDVFVFLDDSQFQKNYLNNRNKIKTPQGWTYLTIPVEKKDGLSTNINETRTKDELKWKEKHLKTLEMNYKKCPYYDEIFPEIKGLIEKEYNNLAELNEALIIYIATKFGILPEIVVASSTLGVKSSKEERVLDICKMFNADEYLSGNGAKNYQKEEDFTTKGIKLTYIDYKPIEYNQRFGEFIEGMSVLDYIFNNGYDFNYVVEEIEKKKVHNERGYVRSLRPKLQKK